MKYIIMGSMLEWFSGKSFIQVGEVHTNEHLGVCHVGQGFFNNHDKTVDPLSGLVNWLDDACCLHFCQLLFENCLLMNRYRPAHSLSGWYT